MGRAVRRLFGGISSMIHVVPPLGSYSEAVRDEKASTRLRPLYRGAVVVGGASCAKLSWRHVVPPLGSFSEAVRDEKASTRLEEVHPLSATAAPSRSRAHAFEADPWRSSHGFRTAIGVPYRVPCRRFVFGGCPRRKGEHVIGGGPSLVSHSSSISIPSSCTRS